MVIVLEYWLCKCCLILTQYFMITPFFYILFEAVGLLCITLFSILVHKQVCVSFWFENAKFCSLIACIKCSCHQCRSLIWRLLLLFILYANKYSLSFYQHFLPRLSSLNLEVLEAFKLTSISMPTWAQSSSIFPFWDKDLDLFQCWLDFGASCWAVPEVRPRRYCLGQAGEAKHSSGRV